MTGAKADGTLQPWVEKYRPRYVSDVVHHEDLKQILQGAQKTGHLPHLLFHGPPGTGKTSTILALARTLFGVSGLDERVLELNASDERGLGVVRDKIKTFSKVSVSLYDNCPRLKLVILDEADTMTPDAQSALRRTMETYATVTRFCLVCNYVSKIMASLASRCAKFRFSPLTPESMKERLMHICEQECVLLSDCSSVLDAILTSAGGDMRKSINLLQSVSQLPILATPESVAEVAGEIPKHVFHELWRSVVMHTFEEMVRAVSAFVEEGYSVSTVLRDVQHRIASSSTVSDQAKAVMCTKLMEVECCLGDGADEELQLLDLCCVIRDVYKEVNENG